MKLFHYWVETGLDLIDSVRYLCSCSCKNHRPQLKPWLTLHNIHLNFPPSFRPGRSVSATSEWMRRGVLVPDRSRMPRRSTGQMVSTGSSSSTPLLSSTSFVCSISSLSGFSFLIIPHRHLLKVFSFDKWMIYLHEYYCVLPPPWHGSIHPHKAALYSSRLW